MEDFDKIKDQMKPLLSLVKDTENTDIEVDIYLQIFSFKETERDSKKVYMMSLCDQDYKFNSFFLASNENIPELKEGKIIHIKEVSPRKIKNSKFIRIKEFELLGEPLKINEVKEIKMEDLDKPKQEPKPKPKNEMQIEDSSMPLSEDAYTSLKQLTTFSRDFIILIRVTKKSEIKTFESRSNAMGNSQGKLFYFIVLDRDGNEMQCTCFNKAVDKFFDIIEEDQTYEIKGGYVLYSIVDLCVVVLNVGEKMIKNTRNGSQPLKKIVVGDVSKYKIEISLWRVHSDTNVKFGDILLINNVKIGEYKGRTLTTFDETCIKINPPLTNEYVKELDEFIQKYDIKNEFLDLENNSEMKTETKEESENYNSVHIRDVLESLDEFEDVKDLSKVTAIVTQILHNEKNYYLGCSDRNCKRKLKLEGDSDEYICPNCRKSTKTPTYYYTLSLRVKDASTEYKNILESRDEEKLRELTHKVEFKVFNFWVKPKIQTYNTVSKKKLYAYRIEPYNEKTEAHKLVKYLLKEI